MGKISGRTIAEIQSRVRVIAERDSGVWLTEDSFQCARNWPTLRSRPEFGVRESPHFLGFAPSGI